VDTSCVPTPVTDTSLWRGIVEASLTRSGRSHDVSSAGKSKLTHVVDGMTIEASNSGRLPVSRPPDANQAHSHRLGLSRIPTPSRSGDFHSNTA
jgi:hypothetical protein